MSYEIRADYHQQYLLPVCVEDWVPLDHPARFIREYVDSLELPGLGFRVREALDGRPNSKGMAFLMHNG
jgi:transposase